MGSYVVKIEKAGYFSTRFPVFIGRNQEITTTVRLYENHRIPPGFAYIPAGPFTRFGDPNVLTFPYTAEITLPDYAIAVSPVTCGEYLEFLNQLVRSDPEEARARCPRASETTGFLWQLDGSSYRLPPKGKYPWSESLPVFCVSFDDALAYCRYRSKRDGLPYDLSSEAEREKAAKGVDGRFFSWGDHFDNEYANNYYAREGEQGVIEIDAYPQDCSPYGVRGMVGNVSDWCYLEGSDRQGAAALCGGNWALTGDACRLAVRRSTSQTYVSDRFGFRLKLVLTS